MKVGRALIAGIVIAIISFVIGWVTCGWLFNWVYALSPVEVWKPFTGMTIGLNALATLFFGIVLALVYAIFYKGIPKKGIKKGLFYGFLIWLISLHGMFATALFTTINNTVVFYWSIQGLVQLLIMGLVLGAIYKDK